MSDASDRRREARAEVRGAARLGGARSLFQVLDVSRSGLRVRGRELPRAGLPIDVLMRVLGTTLELSGRVAWARRDGGGAALAGLAIDPEDHETRALHDLCERSQTRSLRGTALLVDADPARRALLAEYMWGLGYDIVEAAAPLEAIEILAAETIALVAVAPHLSSCSGEELLGYVAESFPRTCRVVIESGEPEVISASETRSRFGCRAVLHAVVRAGRWAS